MIHIALNKKLMAADGLMNLAIDMTLVPGTLTTIYGPSGAGKTSILKMIAGVLTADSGRITFPEDVWLDTEKNICLKPQQRKIGFVFQDYTLFPNMTVKENLLYALEKGQDQEIIHELIQIIELEDLQNRKPDKLSGGQKQRVALARALVRKPKLLLLDEPLSALDRKMRSKLQDYILNVHQRYELTTLLISHEISEVIKMSDHVIQIDKGRVQKSGKPLDVFTTKQVSGKFQLSGEVVAIKKEDVVYVVTILIGSNFIKVIADESEINTLAIGDTVIVASKAFNPLLQKTHQ